VTNEANDSQLLHPMSMATMEVLEVNELKVLADGGYSNAQAVAQCERDHIEVAAPIKRGAMSTDFSGQRSSCMMRGPTQSGAPPARR
jgi:hypothetical protein